MARIRNLLPDASYTGWDEIGAALSEAITHPLNNPVVPASVFARYAGVSLAKKLGIKENTVVALCAAPQGFEGVLGDLPKGVVSDLSQPVVRQIGLAVGLVDFKVASIDATWTGLRFTQRKSQER